MILKQLLGYFFHVLYLFFPFRAFIDCFSGLAGQYEFYLPRIVETRRYGSNGNRLACGRSLATRSYRFLAPLQRSEDRWNRHVRALGGWDSYDHPQQEKPIWIFAAIEVWSRLWPWTVVGRQSYGSTLAIFRDIFSRSNLQGFTLIAMDGFDLDGVSDK